MENLIRLSSGLSAKDCSRARISYFAPAMTAAKDSIELEGLRVTVDDIVYQDNAVTPPNLPHCFAYFISIHNNSDRVVTIKGRKWVVRSEAGDTVAVEGDGVVGQFPTIAPGARFSYNSFHLFQGRFAVAEGSYLGADEEGQRVLVRIPPFKMVVPGAGGD